jgi:hypothetical protein
VIPSDSSDLGCSSRGTDGLKEFDVRLVIISPLLGNIVLVIDGLDWTNWLTGTAVNALIRVNVKHAVTLVDAIYWALLDAGLVL